MDGTDAAGGPDAAARPASRRLALVAFLLAVTSLLLPWWRVAWDAGAGAIRDDVHAFRPEPPLTTTWGPWLTGALVAVAVLLLFVRTAARSDVHEPPAWRRDLRVAAALLLLALLSGMLWPAAVPSFWGGRTYADNVTDGTRVTETTMPGLGWWVAVLALACVAGALLAARPTPVDPPLPPPPPPGTTSPPTTEK